MKAAILEGGRKAFSRRWRNEKMRRFSPSKKLLLLSRIEPARRPEKLRSDRRRRTRERDFSVTRVISVSSLLESRIETAFHINTKDHEVRTFQHHLLLGLKCNVSLASNNFEAIIICLLF